MHIVHGNNELIIYDTVPNKSLVLDDICVLSIYLFIDDKSSSLYFFVARKMFLCVST